MGRILGLGFRPFGPPLFGVGFCVLWIGRLQERVS